MAPKPEEYMNDAYECISLNTADLRNISGDLSKSERQKTFAVATIVEKNRVTIEYMRGNTYVSCECACLHGARVHVGTKVAIPMWPSWSKSMGVEWITFKPADDVLGVWCFDKNKCIMRCTYELHTKPWNVVAKSFPERKPIEGVSDEKYDELAGMFMERGEVIAELNDHIAELEAELESLKSEPVEPDAIEPPVAEPPALPALPEPTVVIEPTEVPGATHAAAFYVPDGCTVTVSKVGNAWLEGPSAVTKANADKLKANGWKWARQRKQWWRKAA